MENKKRKPTMTMLLIRIALGGYLMYLAHSLITGMGTSDKPRLLLIFAILFIFAGILLIILGGKAIITKDYYNPMDDEADEKEED